MKTAVQAGCGVLILLLTAAAFAGALPDPNLTPGAVNQYVNQANIHQTICVHGWTKTVRPPASYTNRLKRAQIKEYGYSDTKLGDYEEDHLISLEIGGNPIDRKNLWPEPYAGACGARKKDRIETRLKVLVCSQEITLSEAQRVISINWVSAYRKYIGPLKCGK